MKRREFIRTSAAGALGVAVLAAAGCSTSRVGPTAKDKAKGQPWRCQKCGYLMRSDEDLSNTRCPRCWSKSIRRITDKQMDEYLAKEQQTVDETITAE